MSGPSRLLASRGQQPPYLEEAAFPSYSADKRGGNPGVKTPSPAYRHTSPSDEHLSGAKTQQRLGLATRLRREGLCCRDSLDCFFKLHTGEVQSSPD
jgi:hypothetical protein